MNSGFSRVGRELIVATALRAGSNPHLLDACSSRRDRVPSSLRSLGTLAVRIELQGAPIDPDPRSSDRMPQLAVGRWLCVSARAVRPVEFASRVYLPAGAAAGAAAVSALTSR